MKRFLLIALFILCSSRTQAQILQVPSGQYSSIQSAINNANNYDTVIVLPGIYQENIDFLGKAVTVRSVDPNDADIVAATVIDGSNPSDPNFGSVVTFKNSEDGNSVLSGFTIQNGTGQTDPTATWRSWEGDNGEGGGVFCNNASPVITKNVFQNCRAEYGGGGIFCHDNASPTITHNSFLNNYAGWYGGAIFGRVKCSPTISDNLFRQNQCKYLGGAVYLCNQCYPIITNNRFEQNDCEKLFGGAIYYFIKSAPIIANNFFIGNTCSGSVNNHPTGAAILSEHNAGAGTSGMIINNLFTANSVTYQYGAVLTVAGNTAELIANNIIYTNHGIGISVLAGAGPTIRNNDVWDNTGGNYNAGFGDQTGINGNISEDPQVGPELPEPFTSFELHPNSPCIDAGSNASLPAWFTLDYDRTSREVNAVIDMGPQEYHFIAVPQDFDTIQQAINAVQSGDEILVSPGFYRENVNFLDKNIKLRSINPLDTDCVAQTIIDGNDQGSCIEILSDQNETTIVAGLCLQNGHDEYGGGIHVGDSVGPMVMYNYIADNNANRYGGGIDYRDHSYGKIMNNTIVGNFASTAGGGIHIGPYSSALIENNRIINNITTGEAGGGIYCFSQTTAWITNNEIIGNQALMGNGGGIWLWKNIDSVVEGNIVIGNIATETAVPVGVGRGGGIGLTQGTPVVRNNIVCGNIADEGGGIWVQSPGDYKVLNNTIVGNKASDGAGIGIAFGVTAPVINNIVAYNGPGGGIYVNPMIPSEPNIMANNVWANLDANYVGDISDLTGVAGNISADPCFVDTGFWSDNNTPADANDDYWVYGNYRIGYYSPCRDAADSNYAPETDFDENIRPAFESCDIGAYELQIYDISVTGTVDFTDIFLLTDSWLTGGVSMPADLDTNGFIDFRDFALLSSGWRR